MSAQEDGEPLDVLLRQLRSNAALAEEVERIAAIGSFVFDPMTGSSAWSPELRRIIGIPSDARPGFEALFEQAHPDDREMLAQLSAERNEVGDKVRFQHRLLLRSGEVRHLDVVGETLLLPEHRNPVFVGTVRDITDKVRHEALIAQHEKRLREMHSEVLFLARQSAMATMAATLAHEISQPLTAIANYSAALQRLPIEAERAEELRSMVVALGANALRAGNIVRRMRALMQRGETTREDCNIDELIRSFSEHLGLMRDPAVSLALGCGRSAHVDPIQIEQVLANLVRNGLEAVEASGRRCVTVVTRSEGERVIVSVEDQGPGIPDALLQDFFAIRSSTKPDGMGIGLSICKTIVEAHGGSIHAGNIAGGARISFTLPAVSRR